MHKQQQTFDLSIIRLVALIELPLYFELYLNSIVKKRLKEIYFNNKISNTKYQKVLRSNLSAAESCFYIGLDTRTNTRRSYLRNPVF